MRTHGELPCPACGYDRRGIEHPTPCPECGARGFHGDLVVSGQPETHRESRWAGNLFSVAQQIGVTVGLGLMWWLGNNNPWEKPVSIAVFVLAGVATAVWAYGRYRRRRDTKAGVSLERIAWDFEADGLRVREMEAERFIPYRDIVKPWVQLNFGFTKKTRVQVETKGRASGSFPTIMLCGSSQAQRAAANDIKQRFAEATRAS